MKRLTAIFAALLLLCGCAGDVPEPIAFHNDTGYTVESISADNGPDLLVHGPLQPGAAVRVEYLPGERPCTLTILLESGERLILEGIQLTPGYTVCLDFSDDLTYSISERE